MADNFADNVAPGQPIEIAAKTWNTILESARDFLRHRLGDQPGAPIVSDVNNPLIIFGQNNVGSNLSIFSVVKLSTPTISPSVAPYDFQRRPVLSLVAPASTTDPIGITWEPIASTGFNIGRVMVGGVVLCNVQINSSSDQWAAPIASNTSNLNSGSSGPARILWKASTPVSGSIYLCVLMLYDGAGSGGSGTPLTTEYTDASLVIDPTYTLGVVPNHGLILSNPSSDYAQLDLATSLSYFYQNLTYPQVETLVSYFNGTYPLGPAYWVTIPKSTSFTVLAPSTQWNYYECNGTGIVATLPNPATTAAGTMFAVCNIGTPLVTVNLNGGANFCSLGNEQFVILTLDNAGTGWDIISTNITDGATLTGASYTQPAVNANVTVTVAQTNWMAKFSTLYIAGGGWYFVSSITNATTVVLTNIGVSTNAAAATVISAPVLVENIGADFTPFTPIAASSNFTAVGNTLTCNLYECSSAITATLPAVSATPKGTWIGFINTGTSGTITVTAAGADKIGVAAYASITLTNKDDKVFLTPNQAANGWDIVVDNRITQGSGVTLTRSASGIQVAASSVPGGGVWYGFELDYNSTQLTSIATNGATVALLVLPQYGALSRYASYVATVFAGSGLTSLTATCGDATNNTFLISTPFNFLNAGTVPQGINPAATNSLRSVTGTTQINLYLTANAGFQLKNLTAGKFWIWVEISAGVTPVAI